jgi:hypothetical protein
MMTLKMVVDRYRALTRGWGTPAALSEFGLSAAETEKLFGGLDEDYHISRHLHFSTGEGPSYRISGEDVTHIAIDEGISNLL